MNKADFMSDYVNIKKIKKGGQKTVYKAQALSGQDVALKLIYNAHDPRVLQEIEILTRLNIKNIPKIISSGYIKDDNSDEEALYIVEDFIQGKSLRDYLNEGNKFSLKNAYNLLNKLLTIEVDLENNQLLHRDINPNNIMLTPDNDIILIDFGLAKIMNGPGITDTNATHGPFTPGYAPNEQISNKRMEQDVRTDLFQVGVTLYECCTGQNPFVNKNDTLTDVVLKTVTYFPPLLELSGDKKFLFAQLVNMLMAKNLSQRPDSAIKALGYLNAIEKTLDLEE